MFGLLFNISSFVISILFPIYLSFKSLQANDSNLLKSWLIYWIVFVAINFMETFFAFVLNFIPFYPFLRLYFQLWLVLPQTKGAVFLYYNYLSPFLKKHESEIEGFVDNVYGNFWTFLSDCKQFLVSLIKRNLFGTKDSDSVHKPRNKYFNFVTSYFGMPGNLMSSDEAADEKLSMSYMESLLNQFKEQKTDEFAVDSNSMSFFESFLLTIPKSGYALKNTFSTSNEAKPRSGETSVSRPSSPKKEQADVSAEFEEEVFDFVNKDETPAASEGIFSSFGWVKVSKEKTE
ncbi:hypothetical protein DASC09_021180 [Saccharomycopsis crataegensis]|uniref:Protein YOP1 n=1 Tax=Saccharomycopsis crataegensis TaxID=43959 RepID=A0AAV5QJ45_9ASCO|nr:hypothetical protein DASC09_021180 [Saccharomycopsis crataegensis]